MICRKEVESMLVSQIKELVELNNAKGSIFLSRFSIGFDGNFSLEVESLSGKVLVAYPVDSSDVENGTKIIADILLSYGLNVLNEVDQTNLST